MWGWWLWWRLNANCNILLIAMVGPLNVYTSFVWPSFSIVGKKVMFPLFVLASSRACSAGASALTVDREFLESQETERHFQCLFNQRSKAPITRIYNGRNPCEIRLFAQDGWESLL